MKSAAEIFAPYGIDGKAVVLGKLASAAYHLVKQIPIIGNTVILSEPERVGTNIKYNASEADYGNIPATGLTVLTAADLPELPLQVVHGGAFNIRGLTTEGIYLNGNAAALVARSSDALFLSFRGTNDDPNFLQAAGGLTGIGGTPDSNDWHNMGNHYKLLQPVSDAIDKYLSIHPEIKHVYVTGHSLGAAMAQHYMDLHRDPRFEAVTFANPGYGSVFTPSPRDSHIANVYIRYDPTEFSTNQKLGDSYEIADYNNNWGSDFVSLHDMQLYNDSMQFLSSQKWSLPQPGLASNATDHFTTYFTDINRTGTTGNPWLVTLPLGSGNAALPTTVIGNLNDDVMGIRGNGSLIGSNGRDVFSINPGAGQVTIYDFTPGVDLIQMDKSLFGLFSDIATHTVDNQTGSAVIADTRGDSITVSGILKSQLHQSDFTFV